jgi:hypothetical protein
MLKVSRVHSQDSVLPNTLYAIRCTLCAVRRYAITDFQVSLVLIRRAALIYYTMSLSQGHY